MLSYAGVPLIHDAAVAEWAAANVPAAGVYGDDAGWPAPTPRLPASPGPRRPPPDGPVRCGRLWWPWGASRYACAAALADDAALAAIRREVYAGAGSYRARPLLIDEGPGRLSVSADMWLLPPRPLAQCQGGAGLWLLPLVDDRWRWWRVAADVAVTPGTTTWAQLFAAIGVALGVAITVDAVPAAYLKPSADLAGRHEHLTPLLDAAAASVGMRVVRTLDGAVKVTSATTALAQRLTNMQAAAAYAGGGRFALAPDGAAVANDLNGAVPSSVCVVFPDTTSATPHAVTVTLASLALTQCRGAAGDGTTRLLLSTAAYDGANGAELAALAAQAARDHVLWQLADLDATFVGACPWPAEALHDLEWAHSSDAPGRAFFALRVVRSPAPGWAARLYQHGSAGSTWPGPTPPPGTTINYYGTTINNVGVTNNYDSTSVFDLYAPTFNVWEDTTWLIDAATVLIFSGGGAILIEVVLEICNWWAWCYATRTTTTTPVNDLPAPSRPTWYFNIPADVTYTGIAPVDPTKAQTLLLVNEHLTNTVTLASDDASSSAANRLRMPGGVAVVLQRAQGVLLHYNPDVPGWYAAASTAATGAPALTASHSCRAYNNANISIPDAAWTAVTLNSERTDTDGIHSTTSDTARLTVPAGLDGVWRFGACVEMDAGNAPSVGVRFKKNGTSVIAQQVLRAPGAPVGLVTPSLPALNLHVEATLAAGDHVTCEVYQNSGGAANLMYAADYSPEVWASFVGA